MAPLEIKKIPGARKAPLPKFIAPQLATLVKEPPSGKGWFHELKFDGYRMLCRINRGKAEFWSRNGKDWTEKFLALAEVLKSLPVKSAILDGEIVVVDTQGRSSFQKLQRAMGKSVTTGFVFEAFDLVYLDGFDLTKTPLRQRKELLKDVCKSSTSGGLLRYSEHFEGNGDAFFKHACEYGIEGVVSKRADSLYASTRNRNWLKVKCNKQQEFVIAGYTPSSKNLPGFASLVLGVHDKGRLVYAGRVGTGFTVRQRVELQQQLNKFPRIASPFAVTPNDPGLKKTRWTEPRLVAEVAFTEWTSDGSIRHPSFQGLREDKNPKEVIRESA
jgi:bifunctional non-homologous end joining protein LigD